MPDLDLESLKRSIDLIEYARSMGYRETPRDRVPGITVLEHERLGDRIAVARLANGGIYARIADYAHRAAGEPAELAGRRLRDCITRSTDNGSIVEFVRDSERRAGRPEPDVERVREQLAAWQQVAREVARGTEQLADPSALGRRIGDWKPSPLPHEPRSATEVQARLERWRDAQRVVDRRLAHRSELATPSAPSSPSRAPERGVKPELALRRYDWSPPLQVDLATQLGRSVRGRGRPERDR